MVRHGAGNGVVLLIGSKTYFDRTTELVQIASPKLHIEAVVSELVSESTSIAKLIYWEVSWLALSPH